jgi:predicted DNA-binding transcriptional regulator AlpA
MKRNAAVPFPFPGSEPDCLLRPMQIARMLCVSRSTFERMLAGGQFPPPEIRIGRATLWRLSTVQRWITDSVLRMAGGGA